MNVNLLNIKNKHPLTVILLVAVIVRLVAAIFSKGYGFESEHFIYVETPNAWLDNFDNSGYDSPRGISLFYVSINYLIFGFFKLLGIGNPQWLMFCSRLIHGTISLTIITLGYRITRILADKKVALRVAWLLALLWFFPYVSVHNLAQTVSIPFLLYGTLLVLKQEKLRNELRKNNLHRSSFIIAGVFFGLAFSVWYQTLIFYVGILIALFLSKNLKSAVFSLLGFLLAIGFTQTIPDLIVWGRPFVELREFLGNSSDYLFNSDAHAPWIYYSILTIITGLIIPYSLMLMFGFFKVWKKHLMVFLPTFLFLLFYTILPNYHEIYIIPVIPMFVILGCTGWDEFSGKSAFWLKNKRLLRYFYAFSCFVNVLLLMTTSVMYSNKPEVKAMTYLSKCGNIKCFVIEDEFSSIYKRVPLFYEKNWDDYIIVNQENKVDLNSVKNDVDYIVFRETKDLERRVEELNSVFPDLTHEITYKPYFAQILYKWLNHSVKDGCVAIYKVNHESR